jgi:hypothetical protein
MDGWRVWVWVFFLGSSYSYPFCQHYPLLTSITLLLAILPLEKDLVDDLAFTRIDLIITLSRLAYKNQMMISKDIDN